MIKLIAIDMDGTLLNSQKQISVNTINALQQATNNNIKIVLCTGRSWTGVKPFYEQLKKAFSQDTIQEDFIIINNGCATLRGSDYNIITSHHLSSKNIQWLQTFVKNQEDIQYTLFDLEHYYCLHSSPNQYVQFDASLVYTTPTVVHINDIIKKNRSIFQAMFLGEKQKLDMFQEKYESILNKKFSVVRSQDYIFEIMPKNITKCFALKQLCSQLNISSREVMAIGDGNNDLEMLQYARIGVAMANATKLVKENTHYQTLSNDEDGVAHIITQLLNGQLH